MSDDLTSDILTLRVPPEIHRKIAIKSAEEGVSINQYILSRLRSKSKHLN